MPHYLIDGNNLLGKLSVRDKSFLPENPSSRELLVLKLSGYFQDKKDEVILFFDGYENDRIRGGKIRIMYSNKRPADLLIREKIEHTKNRKTLCVVSSDNEIRNFAKVCSCRVIKSEEFAATLSSGKKSSNASAEDEKNTGGDKEFFIKIFSQGN